MASNLDLIEVELTGIGYDVRRQHTSRGEVVVFCYCVESGSKKGQTVEMGISMHRRQVYPEYPPHWIHITPPTRDGLSGAVEEYTTEDGRRWITMSRPPGPIWDQLPTKHMTYYLSEHVRRFWNGI